MAKSRGPGSALDPCVLILGPGLRAVRGRGHALLRPESALNASLCAGFRGFVSKLWLTTSAFALSPLAPAISPPGSHAWEHALEVLCA